MEDYPDKILMNSAEQCCPVIEVQNLAEESSLVSNTVTGSSSSETETGGSSGDSITASEGTSVKYGYRNLDTNSRGKCLSDSKEIVGPDQVEIDVLLKLVLHLKERQSSDPVSMNITTNMDSVNGIEKSENKGFSQIYPDTTHTSSSNSSGHGDYLSNGLPLDNHMGEVTDMPSSNSDSVNHRSNVPVTFRSTQDESIQDPVPSDLGFLVPNREQGRTDGSVLHVDVVSISSSIYSSSNSDTSSREARRNSRRLFRDAFSRRSSRRHVDSPTIVFSTDNTDDLESHDRWLLDFSGDFFDDGIGSDSGYMSRRIHRLNERRRHSRSEIWERLRGGLDENGRRTSSCPSGLHPDGTCSCESFLMAEDSSARGSISRIVMLAEALFEVLDEIHRQPVSLSLSMMSLPAPESVVDSFPLKNHKKLDRVKGNEEDEQCYICLAEYEEGDKIRVLPCHHEYHMACVDKWLKEIHGVCPLCRGDVREGASESSIPNPEITST
ncbi:RING ZINC FINGER DOMAIN SUPERFAMILY PROTEIN-RELATED [Salix viminalis]|uniref:RING ZINC FINGER DOMAIN SUPERFAMILY PROTEIN-RELATED n=1 Tax=Salix viminalis TaxID=40686 RepID=A0A9Q0NP35_SALVM|nr:RING ZINC FINGER DOMAIN SUPERFAMILY PROTEIN-RELATED [Salix viminalis]